MVSSCINEYECDLKFKTRRRLGNILIPAWRFRISSMVLKDYVESLERLANCYLHSVASFEFPLLLKF